MAVATEWRDAAAKPTPGVRWTMTNLGSPRTGRFVSRLLVLYLVCIGLARGAEVDVRIERQDDTFNVEANVLIATDPRVAWNVLTDYGNLANFVPGMTSSRIVSAPGQPLLLEQKGESGFLMLRVPIDVVSRIEEVPPSVVRFQSVGGNLRNKQGEWAVARHDHATRVTYRASITPGFSLPPLIGPAIVGRDVKMMVESVAGEMLRRAVSTPSPAGAGPAEQ